MKPAWMLAAAAPRPGSLFSELLPWLIALLLVVVVGVVVIYFIRRSLRGSDAGAAGFSLQELRELRAAGRLTDDEFERAKTSIIGRLSQGPPGDADPHPGPDSEPKP